MAAGDLRELSPAFPVIRSLTRVWFAEGAGNNPGPGHGKARLPLEKSPRLPPLLEVSIMTHPTVRPPLSALADHSYDPEVLVLAADLAEVAAERDQAERDRDHRASQVSDLLVDMAHAHQREQDLKDQVHSLLLALGAAEREVAQLRESTPALAVRADRSQLAAAA